jgi:homogentisate 1,2-dioxygenase
MTMFYVSIKFPDGNIYVIQYDKRDDFYYFDTSYHQPDPGKFTSTEVARIIEEKRNYPNIRFIITPVA